MSEQNTATINITSKLSATGTGFGVVDGTGESCFIPPRVMAAARGNVGDVFLARITENPLEERREHTPYMVTGMTRVEDPVESEVRNFIQSMLLSGGVWTVGDLFHEYTDGAPAKNHIELYHVFVVQSDDFYVSGQCARFTMEREHGRGSAKVWYTCNPDLADVAEWEPD